MIQHDRLTAASGASTPPSRLTDMDIHLFNEGTHQQLYQKLGCHFGSVDGVEGAYFAVWAPDAAYVAVIGDFNQWDRGRTPLQARGATGVWEGFVPGIAQGSVYKYHIASRYHDYRVDKADPFAFAAELPPRTGSVAWDLGYTWGDAEWMAQRAARSALDAPIAIYEVHLGSWMRVPEEQDRFLTYRELAPRLADYVEQMGFTHVEFLPLMEHPYYASWGYQTTGYFAPTSRYGRPQDLMFLIDYLHQRGIGVILDWVPSHFPSDQHGLSYFDGTHVYEHADLRQGFHPDWNSLIFNYDRNEVRAFLISSAVFWLSVYHADGLRVDAVASMLYLDYSRKPGEWIPNQYGGRENLAAIGTLRQLNYAAYTNGPGIQMVAEESTSWPLVSRPPEIGGLGFGYKWDMGWMHDTLKYIALDSLFRRYQHNLLTFRSLYAFSENFILPLSHDEVVHGKGSLLNKMPGDVWQKFANLRLLFGYMYGQPAKKLLFMGGELGQWREWDHDRSLDWHLTEAPPHAGVQRWVADLNRTYRAEPALHRCDCDPIGFQWIEANDADQSVISFLRRGGPRDRVVLVVCNFTPVPRYNYRVGVHAGGFWRELLNSDAVEFGGSGIGNLGGVEAAPLAMHGQPYSLNLTLPPLAVLFLRSERP